MKPVKKFIRCADIIISLDLPKKFQIKASFIEKLVALSFLHLRCDFSITQQVSRLL